MHRHPKPRWGVVLAIGAVLLVLFPAQLTLAFEPDDLSNRPTGAAGLAGLNPAVTRIWRVSDGQITSSAQRPWLWGESPLAVTAEYYRDSPTHVREMVYFDKGRLDILDPTQSPSAQDYVTSAPLVAEMLSGKIRFGEHVTVPRNPAQIVIYGDAAQPNGLTYATLAGLATNGYKVRAQTTRLAQTEHAGNKVVPQRTGQMVTDLLTGRGIIERGGVAKAQVKFGAYDRATGHNIAAPFVKWGTSQPYTRVWLLGQALTEPYWTDTVVNGQVRRVLIQAFEHRMLIFDPEAKPGWPVVSADVGLHYRQWRNPASSAASVTLVDYESLRNTVGIAPWMPLITKAADEAAIPWQIIASIMTIESGGDPKSLSVAGAVGLMQIMPNYWEPTSRQYGPNLWDPWTNIRTGADILARNYGRWQDWDKAAAAYFGALSAKGEITGKRDGYGTSGYMYVEHFRINLAAFGFGLDLTSLGAAGSDPTTPEVGTALQYGLTMLGVAYVWGGESPEEGGFDCSGLVQWSHRQAGIMDLPRTAAEQWGYTQRITPAEARPGDLIFFAGTNGPGITHVGYYAGDGLMLNAPREGKVIELIPLSNPYWSAHLAGFGRYVPGGAGSAPYEMPDDMPVEPVPVEAAEPEPIQTEPVPEEPSLEPEPGVSNEPVEPEVTTTEEPTPEPTETPVATETPTSEATPTPEVTPTPDPTAEPTPEPTATPEPSPTEPIEPTPDPNEPGALIGTGLAALDPESHLVEWWDARLKSLGLAGMASQGWQLDPNGYYCLQPGYRPGDRLRVKVLGGATITCTVGDYIPGDTFVDWSDDWIIQLNTAAWGALELTGNEEVKIFVAE